MRKYLLLILVSGSNLFYAQTPAHHFSHSEILQKHLTPTECKYTKPIEAQQYYQILDSIKTWTLDTVSGAWIPVSIIKDFAYDANHRETDRTYYTINAGLYQPLSRYNGNYNGMPTSYIDQYFSWSGSVWTNNYRKTHTYNGNSYPLSTLTEIWNSGAWKNNQLLSYYYNSGGNADSMLSQYWSTNYWSNDSKTTYTFDTNNVNISSTTYNWSISLNKWDSSSTTAYTYDSYGNPINYLTHYWTGASWIIFQVNVTYDSNHNPISQVVQNWKNGQWINNNSLQFSYDVNDLIQSMMYMSYDTTGHLTLTDSTYYYYQTIVGISENVPAHASIQVFPNPASDDFSVSVNEADPVMLTLYDLNGNILFDRSFTRALRVDTRNIPAGIYTLSLRASSGVNYRKVVVSH